MKDNLLIVWTNGDIEDLPNRSHDESDGFAVGTQGIQLQRHDRGHESQSQRITEKAQQDEKTCPQ